MTADRGPSIGSHCAARWRSFQWLPGLRVPAAPAAAEDDDFTVGGAGEVATRTERTSRPDQATMIVPLVGGSRPSRPSPAGMASGTFRHVPPLPCSWRIVFHTAVRAAGRRRRRRPSWSRTGRRGGRSQWPRRGNGQHGCDTGGVRDDCDGRDGGDGRHGRTYGGAKPDGRGGGDGGTVPWMLCVPRGAARTVSRGRTAGVASRRGSAGRLQGWDGHPCHWAKGGGGPLFLCGSREGRPLPLVAPLCSSDPGYCAEQK